MKIDKTELTYAFLFLVLVMFVVVIIGTLAVQSKRHLDDLEKNGCKEQFRSETGQRKYCGKACTRPEIIVIYECFNGRKVELLNEIQ